MSWVRVAGVSARRVRGLAHRLRHSCQVCGKNLSEMKGDDS